MLGFPTNILEEDPVTVRVSTLVSEQNWGLNKVMFPGPDPVRCAQ